MACLDRAIPFAIYSFVYNAITFVCNVIGHTEIYSFLIIFPLVMSIKTIATRND